MSNKEKIEEIVIDAFEGYSKVGFTDEEMIAILSKLAEWKDKQLREYIEEKLADIIFECIEEYKKLKGSLNDDGTLQSDYQLAQNIAITCETKVINELFKED